MRGPLSRGHLEIPMCIASADRSVEPPSGCIRARPAWAAGSLAGALREPRPALGDVDVAARLIFYEIRRILRSQN